MHYSIYLSIFSIFLALKTSFQPILEFPQFPSNLSYLFIPLRNHLIFSSVFSILPLFLGYLLFKSLTHNIYKLMSIFNRLLDKDENTMLPGDMREVQEQKKSYDFFFCMNIKKYFQIQEEQITARMKSAILMKPPFKEVVENHPDLYGPFWLATTLIVIIVASSSLISFFYSNTSEDGTKGKQSYDFDEIPVAGALIYGICFGAPYIIAIMVKIFGATVSVVEVICVYGYSLTIFLPVTLFLFLNSVILQTILLVIAYAVSTVFLIRGILSMDRKMGDRQKMAIGVFIMGVQFVLVIMYKFYFFDLY